MPIEKNQVQVIARAATILRALENQPAGLSLAQIADRVDLPRSTVQRIVAALEAERLLAAASPNQRVRLGPALLRLAASVETDATAAIRPYLVSLSAALGETVDVAAVRKDTVVFLDQIAGSQRLRAISAVGEAFPLTCTANGKAYLAELTDKEVERLVGRRFPARTATTLTRLDALLAEIATIRRDGVAYDLEEHTLGISAAGIALHDPLGNPIAISVPVPTTRFKPKRDAIAHRLLETKRSLIERFAGEPG